MNNAIYVYDIRTTMHEPMFIVYDEKHINLFLTAMNVLDNNHEHPSWIYISYVRMHKNSPPDPYKVGSTSYTSSRPRSLVPSSKTIFLEKQLAKAQKENYKARTEIIELKCRLEKAQNDIGHFIVDTTRDLMIAGINALKKNEEKNIEETKEVAKDTQI